MDLTRLPLSVPWPATMDRVSFISNLRATAENRRREVHRLRAIVAASEDEIERIETLAAALEAEEARFRVQAKLCKTCIYRKDSPLDLAALEDAVRDRHVGFKGHRVCHHSKDVCCAGFWRAHKDEFPMGQIAQRLGVVEFVNVDTLGDG